MSHKWTARQLQYIEWCATPWHRREPRTQEEMAGELGCTARTLQRWQVKAGFWQEVDTQVKKWVGRRSPDILDAMIGKAMLGGKDKDGDVPAARLVLGYAGKYAEKKGGDTQIAVVIAPYQQVLFGWKEAVDEIILLVPESGRGRAQGILDRHLARLEGRISGEEPVEAGVFRPLLQDKE